MHMPNMPDMPKLHLGGEHTSHRRFLRPNPMFLWFVLVESLYWAACAACFLLALHRIADGVKMEARLKALKTMPEAFTDEERVELIHKVKSKALGPF
jgi:hypothetical protein